MPTSDPTDPTGSGDPPGGTTTPPGGSTSTGPTLPAAAKRSYRGPHGLSGSNINEAGEVWQARETWIMPMSERSAFLAACFKTTQTVTIGGISATRVVPLSHPEEPALLARDFEEAERRKVIEDDDGNRYWGWCKITVTFRSVPFPVSGDNAFISINTEPSNRIIPVPPGFFRNQAGSAFALGEQGLELNGFDLVITTHGMATYQPEFYLAYANRTNNATWRNIPQGRALYRGARQAETYTQGGGFSTDITHTWGVSPELDWSYGPLPGPTLGAIYRPDGTLKHGAADMNAVLAGPSS